MRDRGEKIYHSGCKGVNGWMDGWMDGVREGWRVCQYNKHAHIYIYFMILYNIIV